jgi:hypothetical protein
MTYEERVYISPEDLKEFELRCKNCDGRLSWDSIAAFPDSCPLCTHEWFKRGASPDTRKMNLFDLAMNLKKLRENFNEVGCSVAFRIATQKRDSD